MNRGQHAQLWGGPEDGATLYVPPGELPALIGAHRTLDGALVPIRGRALHVELEHVEVYERATEAVMRSALRAGGGRYWVPVVHPSLPLYVHRDLVTRWTTQGQM